MYLVNNNSSFSIITYDFSNHELWLGLKYQIGFLSCGTGLNSNQKEVGYFHNRLNTLVPVATSCLATWYCYIQVVNGVRLLVRILFPATWIGPVTNRDSQQGGNFQPSFCLNSTCPAFGYAVSSVIES